ncbi:MAG TPA: hypothetical protein V6C81_23895 [Planktothrix sp.]|jgi:hypothetical protein
MSRTKAVVAALSLLLGSFSIYGVAPASAEKLLEGQVCEENVHKLTTEIDWNKNLKKAEKQAAEENKLVFWVHIVGKIDGAT